MTVWLITRYDGGQVYATTLHQCAFYVFDRGDEGAAVEVIEEALPPHFPKSAVAPAEAVDSALEKLARPEKPTGRLNGEVPPPGNMHYSTCCDTLGRHMRTSDGRCFACR